MGAVDQDELDGVDPVDVDGTADPSDDEPPSGSRASGWTLDLRADRVPVRWTAITLAGLCLLSFARSPYIFTRGRFWAEEGVTFFNHMWTDGGVSGLGFVYQRTGYFNLFANGATWIAAKVPLGAAPTVTVWLSFTIVALLAWIALTWPSDLLPNAGARLAAAVLLTVGTAAFAEVWLNSINAQVTLALITVLLLFVRVDELRRWQYVLALVVLVLACMTGPYSTTLAPLFLLVALRDRRPRRWGVAAAALGAAAIQAVTFLSARSSGRLASSRGGLPEAGDAFRSVAGWQLSALALPRKQVGDRIAAASRGEVGSALLLGAVALVVVGVLVAALWRVPKRRVPILLLLAFLLIEAVVQIGALGSEAGGRYVVVNLGILILAVVHAVAVSTSPARWAAAVLAAGILVVGVTQFYVSDPAVLRCMGCPDWRKQVGAWNAGTTDSLQIWPYTKNPWLIELPHRPPDEGAAPAYDEALVRVAREVVAGDQGP